MLSIGASPITARTPQGAAASQEKREVRPPKAVRRFIEIKSFLAKEMEKDPAFRAGVEEVYRQKLREHSEYAAMVNSQPATASALLGLMPEARFERALALLESDGQSQKNEAAAMLRQYVELYRQQHEGRSPPNLNRVNEYLLLAGE